MSDPLELDLHEGPLERRVSELERIYREHEQRIVEGIHVEEELSKRLADLEKLTKDLYETGLMLITNNEELSARLLALEEKERQRTAKEIQLPYEEWAEGAAIIHERRDIEPDTTVISPSREDHDREIKTDYDAQEHLEGRDRDQFLFDTGGC